MTNKAFVYIRTVPLKQLLANFLLCFECKCNGALFLPAIFWSATTYTAFAPMFTSPYIHFFQSLDYKNNHPKQRIRD